MNEEWRELRACRGYDPRLWANPELPRAALGRHARVTERPEDHMNLQARAICAQCEVKEPCLEAGFGHPGIWGGLGEAERIRLGLPGQDNVKQYRSTWKVREIRELFNELVKQ